MVNYNEAINSKKSERLTNAEWQKRRADILQKAGFSCQICGSEASQVDHIKPKAFGGSDERKNLQALCSKCHDEKTREDINKYNRIKKIKKYKKRLNTGFD